MQGDKSDNEEKKCVDSRSSCINGTCSQESIIQAADVGYNKQIPNQCPTCSDSNQSNFSSRKGLSCDDYVNDIKLMLGGSVLNIEVEEQIPSILQMAFRELKNYITDVRTHTIPYSNRISLTSLNVNNVVYVMRSKNVTGMGGLSGVEYIYARNTAYGNSYSLSDYARSLMAQSNRSTLSTDLDFNWDKTNNTLYVYAQYPLPASITIVYTPDYSSVEEIYEPFWQDILRRLAVAMTKEILGRIRGRYTLNSATYSQDSDRLLSEAQAELSEIRGYLRQNSDLLLPLD